MKENQDETHDTDGKVEDAPKEAELGQDVKMPDTEECKKNGEAEGENPKEAEAEKKDGPSEQDKPDIGIAEEKKCQMEVEEKVEEKGTALGSEAESHEKEAMDKKIEEQNKSSDNATSKKVDEAVIENGGFSSEP